MAIQYLSTSHGGRAVFSWPMRCAACSLPATKSLAASYRATSDSSFLVVRATWSETPVEVLFPVCSFHWSLYSLPMKIVGMSLWHKVVISCAALAFVGGIMGFVKFVGGYGQETGFSVSESIVLVLPLLLWWVSMHFAPVRIAGFAPPKLWLRIRDQSFAMEFQQANPMAVRVQE